LKLPRFISFIFNPLLIVAFFFVRHRALENHEIKAFSSKSIVAWYIIGSLLPLGPATLRTLMSFADPEQINFIFSLPQRSSIGKTLCLTTDCQKMVDNHVDFV